MAAPFLLDLSHTSHTHARTGIQRVARSLWRELGPRAEPITYDPHQRTWRPLQPWEIKNLTTDSFSSKRSAAWPLIAKLRGKTRRLLQGPSSHPPLSTFKSSGLFLPEVFSSTVASALPPLFAAHPGPRAALFHDAIALKFPELTPPKTVARFPAYLRELLSFDGIAANSDDSRNTLLAFWDWLGVARSNQPVVTTIPLGTDFTCNPIAGNSAALLSSAPPVILSVGSLEGRKNHLSLLDACEQLWASGARFELRLIGLVHPQTGRTAHARIQALQAAGRPLRYDGPVNDATLAAAYSACTFTVYPSLIEGFGLPVLESLSHGKPCICSAQGALGEAARDGGCVSLDRVDAPTLAAAIGRLLSSPDQLTALSASARARHFRTWTDYVNDLNAWLPSLPRRDR